MPASFQIDPERGRVTCLATGVLRGEDISELQRGLAGDPAFRPTFSQLFDFTGVAEARITAAQVEQMARLSVFGPGARRAFVVGSDLAFGLSRMFQIHTDDRAGDLRVFTDRDAAEAWLDEGAGPDREGSLS